jgi:hypothetical protein
MGSNLPEGLGGFARSNGFLVNPPMYDQVEVGQNGRLESRPHRQTRMSALQGGLFEFGFQLKEFLFHQR